MKTHKIYPKFMDMYLFLKKYFIVQINSRISGFGNIKHFSKTLMVPKI